MQLNPARGRKRSRQFRRSVHSISRFMQLNPVRGRKQAYVSHILLGQTAYGLCSSTPRGDGNPCHELSLPLFVVFRFMQLNPARGRKRDCEVVKQEINHYGLCSSTPRGDGNLMMVILWGVRLRFMQLNPARGRKRAHAPLSGHGAAHDLYAHDDTPPCSSPVAAPHAQHISSFLMGGLW